MLVRVTTKPKRVRTTSGAEVREGNFIGMDGTTGEVVKGAKFLSSADTWWCRCQRLPTFPSWHPSRRLKWTARKP
ncbi:hypothetical protein PF004_g70 [Phytophthora fragariae]|uniref:Uncharacterized protein n=1 Tax=Phytophthora fragariae TaxID=53985 RepID=A0A6G0PWW8_9STRA|nr:hypothetical protein PF004_g70 [Phytophthora fragariae]KAE9361906.1 hypothetical protein PF008_g572 [Phytophthora fragariae]